MDLLSDELLEWIRDASDDEPARLVSGGDKYYRSVSRVCCRLRLSSRLNLTSNRSLKALLFISAASLVGSTTLLKRYVLPSLVPRRIYEATYCHACNVITFLLLL